MSGNLDNIQGIIFDLDGTLANTKLNFSAMCAELEIPAGTPLLEYLAGIDDACEQARARAVVERHEMQGAERAEWMPGARDMLQLLHRAGVPMGIVTRNMRRAACLTVERLGIPIDRMVTREDCQPKPHPQGLLQIAADWPMPARDIVYIGDYKFDLQAANSANMIACLIDNGKNASYASLADWVISDFSEVTDKVLQRF